MYKTYSQYNTNGNVYPQAIDERIIPADVQTCIDG